MKPILFLLLSTPLFALAQDKNNNHKDNLKGKVKKITETEYHFERKSGKNVKTLANTTVFKYDEKGHEYELIAYQGKSDFDFKLEYKLDEKGNRISSKEYSENNQLEIKTVYKYDANGNQTEQVDYTSWDSLL